MRIHVVDEIPYSAETVFLTFRDRMAEYVKWTPNITDIVIKERETVSDTIVKMRCDWGGMGQIPAAVRKILKPEMLRWEDWQTWDSVKLTNEWVIKPFYFREFVTCHGTWYYVPKGDSRCEVRCEGVFNVEIKRFPPFPEWILKAASPVIEKTIGGYVPGNLKSTFQAVKKVIANDLKKS